MDIVLFITAFWMFTISVTVALILHLYNTDGDSVCHEYRTLLLGTCLVDVVPLCIVGLTPTSAWLLYDVYYTPQECLLVPRPSAPFGVCLFLLVFILTWTRHSFVLKDALPLAAATSWPPSTSGSYAMLKPPKPAALRTARLTSNMRKGLFLTCLTNGPPFWMSLLVGGALCSVMAVGAIYNPEPAPPTVVLCLSGYSYSGGVLITGVALVHLSWWLFVGLTINVLLQEQGRRDAAIVGASDAVDSAESHQKAPLARMPLLLGMTSIWLPVEQCVTLCVLLGFDSLSASSILFVIWLYACMISFLSLLLSLFVLAALRLDLLHLSAQRPITSSGFI